MTKEELAPIIGNIIIKRQEALRDKALAAHELDRTVDHLMELVAYLRFIDVPDEERGKEILAKISPDHISGLLAEYRSAVATAVAASKTLRDMRFE